VRDTSEWRRLALFFACNVLFGAGLFSHAFLYNFYLDGLGVGECVMGGAAAALTAGGLTALLPAGQVVDRLGAGVSYLAAVALGTAGLVAGAFVENTIPIYVAAFLAGAGTATWRVATGPLMMGLASPDRRARAFSWNVALLLGSGAAWTAMAGAAPEWLEATLGLGRTGGIRAGLIAGATGTLISGLLFLGLRRVWSEQDGPAPPRTTTPLQSVGVPADIAKLVVVVAIWMTAGGLVIPFFNIYFLREHALDVARIGLLLGGAQALSAVVVFASGDIAARLGTRRVLLLWAFPFAPLLWGLGVASVLPLAILLFLVQGFVPPATNPLIDQVLLERAPPGRHGAVSTWRNAATEFAGLAGAAAGGVLLQATSFRTLLTVAGAVAAIGALGLLFGLRGGISEGSARSPAAQ
jgi:MFS family permease